jgi:hypothetical protein
MFFLQANDVLFVGSALSDRFLGLVFLLFLMVLEGVLLMDPDSGKYK